MKIEIVPIEKIHIGTRHRAEFGDLESLATNIREMGLLQPIGIDSYYQLIFGYRRLRACRDILKWESLPCTIFEMKSVIAGEYAENEFRKQFTPTERAAIGKAIEKEEAKKRGRPSTKIQPNLAELDSKGKQARDIAATRVGFRHSTFEQAKRVIHTGVPELREAVDAGTVSISAAANISAQPPDEQRRILQMPKEEMREVLRDTRKAKAVREEDQQRERDYRLFGGLRDAVRFLAAFSEPSRETWEGLSRIHGDSCSEQLPKAIACLVRIEKEHPNVPKRPEMVSKRV